MAEASVNMMLERMVVLFFPTKRSGCVYCGHTKKLRRKFELVKLKAESLYRVRDAIQEDINRELMQGKLISSESQTWFKMVDEIEIKVKRINGEIEQDRSCLRIACCCSDFLDKDLTNVMNEISLNLEKSTLEQSSMFHVPQDGDHTVTSVTMAKDRPDIMARVPQDGGHPVTMVKMDDGRSEMTVHGQQDRGKAIIGSIMDLDMVPIPQNAATTISSSRREGYRSETMSELTKRDDKGKYVDDWSSAEAKVASEAEITTSEKDKGLVEQKKARGTRKTFSVEEMIERKEAARRKAAIRKEESRQRRVRQKKKSGQIKETQHKEEADTSPVQLAEGEGEYIANQSIESVVIPEEIRISYAGKTEIMSEPSDEEMQLSRPIPLTESFRHRLSGPLRSFDSHAASSQSSEEIEISKASKVSQSPSIPTMDLNRNPEGNHVPRIEAQLKPETEVKVISSECSEDSQMKSKTRRKGKRGILSILRRTIQPWKESERPLTLVVEGETIPIPETIIDMGPEYSTSASTQLPVPSSELLMPEQETTVHHILSEEHKEPVLVNSFSSLSRDRKLEHLEVILPPFSEGCYNVIKENMGLTEAPKKEEWEKAHVISLMGNKLSMLPESPDCKWLLKLSLKRNYRLRAIPDSFFKYMPMLQVLELSETRIKSFPLSLDLPSLRVLLLRDCERFVVLPPQVGSLKNLEILDLQGTYIKELPKEVGELTRLVTLQLSFQGYDNSRKNVNYPPELIPSGIICNLFLLKDISIVVDPEDQRWNKNVKSVTNELGNLNSLSALHFYFPEGDCLERFLRLRTSWNARTMSKFRFIVGLNVKRFVSRVPNSVELEYEKRGKCLRFVNGKNVPHALVEVLKCSTAFYLDRHCGLDSLSDIGMENLKNLEFCIIRECHEMRTVIDELEVTVESVLPSLEHLKIHYLQNLTSICKGIAKPGSLIKLKSLALYTCPKLSNIFTLSMFRFLSNLEEMVVEDCQSLKVLISEENIEGDIVTIPRLKRLSLRYLPELVSMGKVVSSWQSLESITIFNCQNLKSISLDRKSTANIKEIKGEKDWWSALEWEDSAILLQLGTRFIPITDEVLLKSD